MSELLLRLVGSMKAMKVEKLLCARGLPGGRTLKHLCEGEYARQGKATEQRSAFKVEIRQGLWMPRKLCKLHR